MDILGLQREVPQDPVGQVLRHEEYGKVALVDLGKDVSEAVRATWPAASPFSAAREVSIVFYRERDGQRALKAYHTPDLRLQQAAA